MKNRLIIAGIATGAFVVSLTVAGPLDPPAGPVADTVNEAEPRTPINEANTPGDAGALFVITEPGSYILTGNITAGAGRDVVRIDSPNVSIDGRGFTITIEEGDPLNSGIQTGLVNDIVIRDLSIVGTHLVAAGEGNVLENVTVRDSIIFSISMGADARLTGCRVFGGSGSGISVGNNSLVENCVVSGVTGNGISGAMGVRIIECVASNCTGDGIRANSDSAITGCTARENGDDGIELFNGSGLIAENNVASNTGFGINAQSTGNEIRDNVVTNNTAAGITVSSSCVVESNNVEVISARPGIVVTGFQARIEGNHVSGGASPAYDIGGTGFFLAKNTSLGNVVDFDLNGSGGLVGPIIQISPGGQNFTISTNTTAWANFVR